MILCRLVRAIIIGLNYDYTWIKFTNDLTNVRGFLLIWRSATELTDRAYDILEVLSKDADFLYDTIETYIERCTEIQ